MPIALPAPATPELGEVEVVRAEGAARASAVFQQIRIHVHGPDVVPQARLEEAITGAVDLSDAVRRIQAAYYLAGYPAARAAYALAEPDLYVSVRLGKLSRVDAPEPYAAYFAGLTDAAPLTDGDLEPARTLASVHADRAGQVASASFVADGPNTVLSVQAAPGGPGRSAMGVGFGNPGNRFVGRHFSDWFGRHSFTTGDELVVTGRHALEGMDDDPSAAGYHEHTLTWGKVTPWGMVSLGGRQVGYQQRIDVPTFGELIFDGDIREVEAGWTNLLLANFSSRWTVGLKAGYARKNLATTDTEQVVQRQEYGSLEASTDYARVAYPFDLPAELNAGFAVRSGLGDDETGNPVKAADLGFRMYRASLGAKLTLGETLSLSALASGQFSADSLPEQQQWVVGGVGNIESYLPGVASGDSGGLARLHLETVPYEFAQLKLVPRIFIEHAVAKVENPIPGRPSGTQSLSDVGVSLAMTYRALEVSASYAEPIGENGIDPAVLGSSEARVFFGIVMRFVGR